MTRKRISILAAAVLLAALAIYSASAQEAARDGVNTCLRVIIPSLLPFFTVSSLMGALGFPQALGRRMERVFRALFGVSGECAAAFFMGLVGGYPLGASAIGDIYRRGGITRDEAQRALCFCNNTGPAFIIGAAGGGIFHSLRAGLVLYLAHIVSAAVLGIILRRGSKSVHSLPVPSASAGFGSALTLSVGKAVTGVLSVCGFVVFFSAMLGILRETGVFGSAVLLLSEHTQFSLHQATALLTGFLELGNGVTALSGEALTPIAMSLCSFMLGWGGISVHLQTAAVLSDTDIRLGQHTAARALHGGISAAIAAALYPLIF